MLIKVTDQKASDITTFLKVLSTLFVVFVHSKYIFMFNPDASEPLTVLLSDIIASAGVPLFFILSGYYLFNKGKIDHIKNIRKKLISLGIPYVVFLIVNGLALLIGHLFMPSFEMPEYISNPSLKNLALAVIGIPFWKGPQVCPPLWFIRELFILNLLVPVISVLIENRVSSLILIPVLIVLWFSPLEGELRKSVVFFTVGCLLGHYNLYPVLKVHYAIPLIVAGIAGTVLMYYTEYGLYSLLTLFVTFPFFTLGYYAVMSHRALRISKYILPFSLIVYLLHWYMVLVPQRLVIGRFPSNTGILTAVYFVLPLIVFLILVIVGMLLQKLLPKVFSFVTGMRYNKLTRSES